MAVKHILFLWLVTFALGVSAFSNCVVDEEQNYDIKNCTSDIQTVDKDEDGYCPMEFLMRTQVCKDIEITMCHTFRGQDHCSTFDSMHCERSYEVMTHYRPSRWNDDSTTCEAMVANCDPETIKGAKKMTC